MISRPWRIVVAKPDCYHRVSVNANPDESPSRVDLNLAAVVAASASAVAVVVGLAPGLPTPLAEALLPQSGLGLVAVAQVLVLTVVVPLRRSYLGPAPASWLLVETLAIALASLPLLVGVIGLLDAPVAAAAPLGALVLLTAVVVAAFLLVVSWWERRWSPAWSRLGQAAPAVLAAVVFALVGPLPVLLGARNDLQAVVTPGGRPGPSPCHVAYAQALDIGRRPARNRSVGSQDVPSADPQASGISLVAVSGPPGLVFRPGLPVVIGLVLQLDRPLSGTIGVRSGGLESGIHFQAPSGGRLVVSLPVVLGRAGYEAASVVWRDHAEGPGPVALPWPAGLVKPLAVDDATGVIGCVGPGARRLAADLAPRDRPVRLVEVSEAEVLESRDLLAEVFDAMVVTGASHPRELRDNISLYAVAGGVVLYQESPAVEDATWLAALPMFPEVASVATGAMGVVSAGTSHEPWPGFDARVQGRRQRGVRRAALCAEAKMALVSEHLPAWGLRDLALACGLAQAVLCFGLLALGVLLRRRERGAPMGLIGVMVLAAGASLPASLAAPGHHVQTATVTVLSTSVGSVQARRDDAVVVWSFGRQERPWQHALPGPLPWLPSRPLARGWVSRGAPTRSWILDLRRWLWMEAVMGRPLTLVRSGVSDTGAIIEAHRDADGMLVITNLMDATLGGTVLLSSRGVIPIGSLSPGASHHVSDSSELQSLGIYRGRLGLMAQQRLRMVGPWLRAAADSATPVVVGFTAGWPEAGSASPPMRHSGMVVEAVVVTLDSLE